MAVLSHALWRGRFASNPAVLGRRLELRNSRVVTIVGVAAPGLEYPTGTEMWVPFASFSGGPEVMPLGRLSPQATSRDAAEELRASFEREPGNELRGLRGAAVPFAVPKAFGAHGLAEGIAMLGNSECWMWPDGQRIREQRSEAVPLQAAGVR